MKRVANIKNGVRDRARGARSGPILQSILAAALVMMVLTSGAHTVEAYEGWGYIPVIGDTEYQVDVQYETLGFAWTTAVESWTQWINFEEAPETRTVDTSQEADQQSSEIFYGLENIGQQNTLSVANKQNHVLDARNLVWASVKYTIAEGITEGDSVNATKARVERQIQDYYAAQQAMMMDQASVSLAEIEGWNEIANNSDTSVPRPSYVKARATTNILGGGTSGSSGSNDTWTTTTETWTLVNGSSYQMVTIDPASISLLVEMNSDGTGKVYSDVDTMPGPDDQNHGNVDWVRVYAKAPANSSLSDTVIMRIEEQEGTLDDATDQELTSFYSLWWRADQESATMVNEASLYTEAAYSNYSAGEIDLTDLISEEALVSQANLNYNETKYFGYTATKLALMGINTSLDERVTVEVARTVDGEPSYPTYSGLLFSKHVPEGGRWEVGTWYDPTGWNDTVFLLQQTGNGSALMALQEPFRITSATTWDGEELPWVEPTNYNRQTADVSAMLEEIRQITELYERMAEMEAQASGGASSGGTSLADLFGAKYLGVPGFVWGVGGVVAVVVWRRRSK